MSPEECSSAPGFFSSGCVSSVSGSILHRCLTENAAQYSITSGYKTATFALADVESVTLLDHLPDEKFYRSDGSADNSKLLGNFRGSKTGHCQMYIWIEHPPVLQIKTTDTTIFLNSSNEAQTKEWYDQLNDAISSNK